MVFQQSVLLPRDTAGADFLEYLHQNRQVALLFEMNPNALTQDLKSAAIGKELVIETFRGFPLMAFKHKSHNPVEIVRSDSQRQIKIYLYYNGRG